MKTIDIMIVCEAIKEQTRQLIEAQQKHYGFYQLCPKCEGEGQLCMNVGGVEPIVRTCPVCNGAKLLVRPEIKEDKTQQP